MYIHSFIYRCAFEATVLPTALITQELFSLRSYLSHHPPAWQYSDDIIVAVQLQTDCAALNLLGALCEDNNSEYTVVRLHVGVGHSLQHCFPRYSQMDLQVCDCTHVRTHARCLSATIYQLPTKHEKEVHNW